MKTKDMIDFAREALGLEISEHISIVPLSKRGSDRTFFRLKWNSGGSAILIHYSTERIENAYYADIAHFLRERRVPVPQVLRHDPACCMMIMDDMGDSDLWSYKDADWETRSALYKKTLCAAKTLHEISLSDIASSAIRMAEGFDVATYRWEREYFMTNFVKGICKIELEPLRANALEHELSALAGRLLEAKPCFVHRDFQSQNVMILNGEPFFIDFQGMRSGCALYDIGSLLNDPYVVFSDDEIGKLLSFYYELSDFESDWDAFSICFWEASVQRLMQALGAYGFLGVKKGLKPFLQHIPGGLKNLLRALSHTHALPELHRLVLECDEKAFGYRLNFLQAFA